MFVGLGLEMERRRDIAEVQQQALQQLGTNPHTSIVPICYRFLFHYCR